MLVGNDETQHLTELIAVRARESGLSVAAAESLTSGRVLSELGCGDGASEWLRGGVVAYSSDVKHDVLQVTPGPVVTDRCAQEMARGVARLLGSDIGVSTTGVGGPEPQDGLEPGTVYIGWWCEQSAGSALHHFEGGPTEIVEQSVIAALRSLLRILPG